ncbi:hypothetical protein Metal_3456 [Methylomicrobium album BG8]|uniref:Lipoprotein n=2 Tax=Methylococcaceae TaxID=403 RepID=H8GRC6_METAL|nr:hypothetical protein Metal_3456 [Methylomicrobium album BG8]
MNTPAKLFTAIVVSLLSACATQPTPQPDTAAKATEPKPQVRQEELPPDYNPYIDPPLTIIKDGKSLNLVRIMDGGICKNELQGASGSFLVYADPHDIDRIKQEKPKEIFQDFETKIQNLSTDILQQAIDQTNLTDDPFSLDDDVMQEKLTEQLTKNFHKAAAGPLSAFIRETTLTIEVTPFPPSLTFYQKGCDMSRFTQ